eukprot:jgi/Chlat1/3753/Chrsp259S00287
MPHTRYRCVETYGLLPCSASAGGNSFLLFAYGSLLLIGAKWIADGSEMLLEVMNPALIGGLLLPLLGVFPDSLLIAVSGLKGTKEDAQQEVLVGVGVLAGSTIMLITLLWAGSLLTGRCDLSGPNSTARDTVLSKHKSVWHSLFHTGVTTDVQTRRCAWIMLGTGAPYLVVQAPIVMGRPEMARAAAVAGAGMCFVTLGMYCAYQVLSPWLLQKRIDEARLHYLRTHIMQCMHKTWGGLFEADGVTPDMAGIDRAFNHFDSQNTGTISVSELHGFVVGLGLEQLSEKFLPSPQDCNAEGRVTREAFIKGVRRMSMHARKLTRAITPSVNRVTTVAKSEGSFTSFWASQAAEARRALELLRDEEEGCVVVDAETAEAEADAVDADDDSANDSSEDIVLNVEKVIGPGRLYRRAAMYLVGGFALISVFAAPMVNTIADFSIPSFFVAFVVTPLASNASEVISSLVFASKRRRRNISLTYSQVYGAIAMNNTMALGTFLVLVYVRGLEWDFTSEVMVVMVTTTLVGVLGSSRTTFKSWMAIPVLMLYPMSLAAVVLLDHWFGWR